MYKTSSCFEAKRGLGIGGVSGKIVMMHKVGYLWPVFVHVVKLYRPVKPRKVDAESKWGSNSASHLHVFYIHSQDNKQCIKSVDCIKL